MFHSNLAFRGGNLSVNSGGIGPDCYLFRLAARGRWYKIIIDTKNNYYNDLACLDFILKNCARTNYFDNRKYYDKHKERITTLTASEFVENCIIH